MRCRCGSRAAAAAVAVWWVPGALAAQPAATDARSVARAGVTATRVLESSPGAPRPAGFRLRFDLVDLYTGTGLVAGCASVEAVGARGGAGVALVDLRSPVGGIRTLRAGAQLALGNARVGLGIDARRAELVRYVPRWELVPRLGIGWKASEHLAAAALVEQLPGPAAAPRGAVALELGVAPGITVALQCDRQPGVPALLRAAVSRRASNLHLSGGYESSTQSCSLGFSWVWGRQEIAWGAATHPALGWSHAWTYAVSR